MTGTGNNPTSRSPQSPEPSLPAREPKAVLYADMINTYRAAVEQFNFKLFAKLAANTAQESNVFVSPMSVGMALAMVFNGAKGNTADELEGVLGVKRLSLDQLNACNGMVKHGVESLGEKAKIRIANSIWPSQEISLVSDFGARMLSALGADVRTLDFRNAAKEAAALINAWVSTKTEGMIPEIVSDLDAETLNVLVNAIFFKGEWTTAFKLEETRDAAFFAATGETVTAPLMRQTGKFQYVHSSRGVCPLQAIRLPYGEDGRAAMVVILPDRAEDLSLLESLDDHPYRALHSVLTGSAARKGTIELPRFRTEFSTELQGVLSDLGMPTAFTDDANFSGMIAPPDRAKIDRVIHKAVVEVDEKGTKAAAATAVLVTRSLSMVPDQAFKMRVDQPFMFVIEVSGLPVFCGSIRNPLA